MKIMWRRLILAILLFGISVPLGAAPTGARTSPRTQAAVVDPAFTHVLSTLRTTQVPLMLPARLHGLHAGYVQAVPGYYWVELDSVPNCTFRYCYVGGVAGQRGTRAPAMVHNPIILAGTAVKLHHGIVGYFQTLPHGADDLPVQVNWQHGGYLYQVFLKTGNQVGAVQMANSAIDATLGHAAQPGPSTQGHRYVVLLDGIDSYDRPFAVSKARVGTTPADHAVVNDFAVVRAGVFRTLPQARIVYFSYAIGPAVDGHGNPALAWAPCAAIPATANCRDSQSLSRRMFQEPSYKQDDTKNFDLRTHADGLNWLLLQIIQKDPKAEIDLVGYSLGGIVASLWAAKYAPTSGAASHVHALTLIESPVGGFALANQVIKGCPLLDLICQTWFGGHGVLATMIGKPVLRDLQLANQGANGTLSYPKGSIVGTLAKNVTPRFDVTAIQSQGDYLVNGASLPLCNHACTQVVRVVIGAGVQSWSPPVMELHGSALLGGHAVTAAYANVRAAVQFLLPNHQAPLRDGQTATWVAQALKTNGPHWVKYRPVPVQKPKILPVTWRTMYVAATAQGGTKVNLRAGPGTGYPIIEQIPNGTAVRAEAVAVKGEGGALWDKVSYGGQTGYVLAELLSLKKPAPVSAPSAQGGTMTTDRIVKATVAGNSFQATIDETEYTGSGSARFHMDYAMVRVNGSPSYFATAVTVSGQTVEIAANTQTGCIWLSGTWTCEPLETAQHGPDSPAATAREYEPNLLLAGLMPDGDELTFLDTSLINSRQATRYGYSYSGYTFSGERDVVTLWIDPPTSRLIMETDSGAGTNSGMHVVITVAISRWNDPTLQLPYVPGLQ